MAERTNNRVRERVYATGVWRSSTAIHLGGEGDSFEHNVDMALLRDSEGSFFAPGSSIAGAARNYLASRLLSVGEFKKGLDNEPSAMRVLFGKPYSSFLTVFDAPLVSSSNALVRDGVAISPASGTADDGAKYNFEVLPAGAAFQFTILLLHFENLPLKVAHEELVRCFRAVLDAFSFGEIRLGAKTQRGLGEGKIDNWRIHRLTMDDSDHVEAWLDQEWHRVPPVSIDDVCKEPLKTDLRRRFTIDASFALKTSILMRAPGAQPGAPDMVHHTENGTPLISGTGLAGAFINRVERIANTMLTDARNRLPDLFRPERRKATLEPIGEAKSEKPRLRRSRVRIDEGPLVAGDLIVQGRNTIDRFTGGTIDGALFDEAPFWPDNSGAANWCFRLSFELQDEQDDRLVVALIMQAFKDLWLGDLSIGGEVGGGRGVMRGIRANLRHPETGQLVLEAGSGDGESVVIKRGDWIGWNSLATLSKPNRTGQGVQHGQG